MAAPPALRALPLGGWGLGLVLLGAVVVIVQLRLLEIPWPADPMFGYMNGATVFSGAGEEMYGLPRADLRPHHRFLRLGLVGTVALFQTAFGYSEFAYYGVGLMSIVAVALLTACLARRVLPAPAAIAAGTLAVLNPVVLHWSSHPQPDLYMTAWLLAALVLLPQGEGTTRFRTGRFIAFGVALGMAWTVKETAPLLFGPVALLGLWASHANRRDVVAGLAGGVLLLAAEAALLLRTSGDPFIRLEVLLGRQAAGGGQVTMSPHMVARRARLLDEQGTYLGAAAAWVRNLRHVGIPMLALLAAPVGAIVAALKERDRWWVAIAAWSLWPWMLYTAIGPTRTGGGGVTIPLSNLWYWHVLMPPTAIGFVALLLFLTRRVLNGRGSLPVAVVLVGALLAAVWPSTSGDGRMIVNDRSEYEEFQDWLTSTSKEDVRITSTLKSVRVLGLYETPPWGGASRATFVDLADADDVTLLALDTWTRTDAVEIGDRRISTGSPPGDVVPEFISSNGLMLLLGPSERSVVWRPAVPSGGVDSDVASLQSRARAGFKVGEHDGILRIRVQGRLERGAIRVECPSGSSAGYGGTQAAMSEQQEWQFFCPTAGEVGGDRFSVVPVGGSLEVIAVEFADSGK